jgi:protoporphyrin/coproporphyrin ferrochelatase
MKEQNSYAQPAKTGVLVVNLGTPEAPTAKAVKAYLGEFLWDKRVVSIPRLLWWLILNGLILTKRPAPVAKNYQKIWLNEGSPLLVYSQRLANKLQADLSDEYVVMLAMRYGQPNIHQVMKKLQSAHVKRLFVLPLYPQYSSTTTASVYDVVMPELQSWPVMPETHFLNSYHDFQPMIDAVADSIESCWQQQGRAERLMMSFHGLPERLLKSGDPYYIQCQITARLIAEKLQLSDDDYQVTFQSRFGREPWLKPYTDATLVQWAKQGVKSVQVCCPGFPVDCLETLEEIAVTNQYIFVEAGGEKLQYINALNDSDRHVAVLSQLVNQVASSEQLNVGNADEWQEIYSQYQFTT